MIFVSTPNTQCAHPAHLLSIFFFTLFPLSLSQSFFHSFISVPCLSLSLSHSLSFHIFFLYFSLSFSNSFSLYLSVFLYLFHACFLSFNVATALWRWSTHGTIFCWRSQFWELNDTKTPFSYSLLVFCLYFA